MVSLKDILGEKKLIDLQGAPIVSYDDNIVIDSVKNNTITDIMYPLISSKKYWTYPNINEDSGAINFNELFPAIKIKKLLELIETTFNINFDSSFFNSFRIEKLFMYLKNKETFYLIQKERFVKPIIFEYNSNPNPYFSLNISQGEIIYHGMSVRDDSGLVVKVITNQSIPTPITLNIYFTRHTTGETVKTTITRNTPNEIEQFNIFYDIFYPDPNLIGMYKFSIETDITATVKISGFVHPYPSYDSVLFETTQVSPFIGSVDIKNYFPDMKVADFLSGLLKMFNLTIYATADRTYKVETLEDYYNAGSTYDLTNLIEDKNTQNRVKAFKRIDFKYTKSESLLNALFFQNSNLEYGNLLQDFNFDGSEYKIELPFENALFTKFTGTKIQVSYAIKSDGITPLVPKAPVLLYLCDNADITAHPFKMKKQNGLIQTLNTYNRFGQDVIDNGANHTMNFGVEQSTITGILEYNNLYPAYYQNYLENIYNIRSRVLKIKALLTPSLVLNLKLNDKIIIAQKAYLINTMKTDLTTGLTDFELPLNLREI